MRNLIFTLFILLVFASCHRDRKKELRVYKLYYLGCYTSILKDSFYVEDKPYIESYRGCYTFVYNTFVTSKDRYIEGVVHFERLK